MLNRLLFWLIVLANLGGAAFGFTIYYGEQLAVTNPLLWIFVADCPLYAMLFSVAFFFRAEPRPRILGKLFGIRKDMSLLWLAAFVGAMKYGFWTVFVLATYTQFYFTPVNSLMYTVLFGAHLFMIFETILLVGRIRIRGMHIAIVAAWFLLNDAADYLLGTHPPLPDIALGFMFPATVCMTLVFTLLSYRILIRRSGDSRASG